MPLSVPASVPGTPVAPAVLTGYQVATVTITPPPNGGSAITAYTSNCYEPYPTLVATQTQYLALDPTANVFTFSGLSSSVQYGFTGIAINASGPSGESPVTLATPTGAYVVSKTVLAGTQQPTSFKSF